MDIYFYGLSYIAVIIGLLHTTGAQDCAFPSELTGSWVTTNLGTVTIQTSTPTLTTNITLTGISSIEFDCRFVSGTQYILQSKNTITVFTGTLPVFIYMCMDLRRISVNSYYYYLNSPVEIGFGGLRLVGLVSTVPLNSTSEVCTETPDTAEFNTMLKIGSEASAVDALICPRLMLGYYNYVYTSTTDTCSGSNSAYINTCGDQNLRSVLANNTGCSLTPFFSAGGDLGCVVSVYSSALSTYYVVLYNNDVYTSINGITITQFTCLAVNINASGTVFISAKATNCEASQSATTTPTGGHTLELTPVYTCSPDDDIDTDYTVLIVLMVLFGILLIVIIVLVCLYINYRKKEKERKKEKKPIEEEIHPLGEISMPLDAPRSMERISENAFIETIEETSRTPRRKKKGRNHPLMDESSMTLDLTGRSWGAFSSKPTGVSDIDPFTEMDAGTIVPITNKGSLAMKNTKPRSFRSTKSPRAITNGSAGKPLAITNGGIGLTEEDFDMYMSEKAKTELRQQSAGTKAPSVIGARSVTQASIRSRKSITARSIKSIKAPSVASAVVKAPSVANGSVKAPSVANGSVKAKSATKRKENRLVRSATSTKIGSITKRLTTPRKSLKRSSTTVVVPKNKEGEGGEEQVNTAVSEFLEAEAGTTAKSETARSRMSNRTTKTMPVTSTGKSPRRSILKKVSAFTTAEEYLTEEEKLDFAAAEGNGSQAHDVTHDQLPHSLRDSYLSIKQRIDIRSNRKRPGASKSPWR